MAVRVIVLVASISIRIACCKMLVNGKLALSGEGLNEEREGEARMPQEIDRDEVRRLLDEAAQLVDVLPPAEYQEDHLPGALNLPLRRIEREARAVLDPLRPVIVYCWDHA